MPREPRTSGFAAVHDAPVPYMQRTRDYYLALGLGAPYEWAHYAQAPFQPLRKPLSQSRLTIVTTAAPYNPAAGDQGPMAPYNAAAKFYSVYSGEAARDHDLRISHVAIDRMHTTAEDSGTYFPLPELRAAVARGRVGALAAHFHGLPTNRSHRTTLEIDCPEIVARCKADGVDAAILVPNCPVCHQSVSLAARYAGGERDRHGRDGLCQGYRRVCRCAAVLVLRFSARQFGRQPRDPASQAFTLELALAVLEGAPAGRTTVQSPLVWSASPDWKLDYQNVSRLSPDEIARRRAAFDVAAGHREGASSKRNSSGPEREIVIAPGIKPAPPGRQATPAVAKPGAC